VWTLAELRSAALHRAVAWVTPAARATVARELEGLGLHLATPAVFVRDAIDLGVVESVDTLVVVGGGALMDRAKLLRRARAGSLRLIVVPSIWGSGAEVSRVAVQGPVEGQPGEGKRIIVDPALVPDVRVEWPELVARVPQERARLASGDAWAHVLEALVSPLAAEDVRRDAAALVQRMLAMPLTQHADWMECSRRACELQARSSVGLVHGIAHTLEAPLRSREPGEGWGHARLCSLFLWPVLRLNQQASQKWQSHVDAAELESSALLERARELFSVEDYRRTLPVLVAEWSRVVRDPCARTNVSVVRPQSLEWFRTLVP